MPEVNNFVIFAGSQSKRLAERVCHYVGQPLGESTTTKFADGEILPKVNENVRGKVCYIIISTCDPVNDNIMELLIFIDCLKRASAKKVVCVIPYFGYARQDRKDQSRVPITAKLLANLITSAGADRVVAVDLHASQIEGFFDIPVDHLHATPVFLKYFTSPEVREELGDLVVVSPDVGNLKVSEGMAHALDANIAIINKRKQDNKTTGANHFIGEVKNKNVLMFDDMISTGGTVSKAALLALEHGALEVNIAATHPIFCENAAEKLSHKGIVRVICTDTIPAFCRKDIIDHLGARYMEISIAELLAEAIIRIQEDRSVSELFHGSAGAKR